MPFKLSIVDREPDGGLCFAVKEGKELRFLSLLHGRFGMVVGGFIETDI